MNKEENFIMIDDNFRLNFGKRDFYLERKVITVDKKTKKEKERWKKISGYCTSRQQLIHSFDQEDFCRIGKKSESIKEFFEMLKKHEEIIKKLSNDNINFGFSGSERVVYKTKYIRTEKIVEVEKKSKKVKTKKKKMTVKNNSENKKKKESEKDFDLF